MASSSLTTSKSLGLLIASFALIKSSIEINLQLHP